MSCLVQCLTSQVRAEQAEMDVFEGHDVEEDEDDQVSMGVV